MNFIEKHKALLITSLISGTLVLAMFGLNIKKKTVFISESYYELEPQTVEELEKLKRLKALDENENSNPKTNQAFNEDEAFKEMMRNFKTVSHNDIKEVSKNANEPIEDTSETPKDLLTSNTSNHPSSKNYALKETERNTYSKANDVLAMHSTKKDDEKSNSNSNSSVTFSLSNRSKIKLPPPVYLCNQNGKIVVNITVNENGIVTDTYINSSSSTTNQCLIDHALEYAKNAQFSTANRKSQIGSITYYFQGK